MVSKNSGKLAGMVNVNDLKSKQNSKIKSNRAVEYAKNFSEVADIFQND